MWPRVHRGRLLRSRASALLREFGVYVQEDLEEHVFPWTAVRQVQMTRQA